MQRLFMLSPRNPRLFSLVRRLLATTNHPDTEVSFSVEVSASLRANKYTVDRVRNSETIFRLVLLLLPLLG